MNIDVHAHYLPRSVVSALDAGRDWHGIQFALNDRGQIVSTTPSLQFALPWPDFRAPIEDRLTNMDRLRVDKQIISMSPSLWRYELDAADAADMARDVNDEIAELAREHPDRFLGFAYLPLQDPRAAVVELERAVTELGLVGAGVGSNVNGQDWDDPRLFPVLEAAERLGAMLFFHPCAVRRRGVLGKYHLKNLIGNPWETTICIASIILGGVMDRLPQSRMLFAHAGGYSTLAIGRFDHGYRARDDVRASAIHLPSDYLRQLNFDSLTHDERALRHVINMVGAERVMLGSDYPADMGSSDPVAWLSGLETITEDEKIKVLGANVERELTGNAPDGLRSGREQQARASERTAVGRSSRSGGGVS